MSQKNIMSGKTQIMLAIAEFAQRTIMTLKKAFKEILKFFNGDMEKAIIWFSVPNTGLGGITPTDMIMRGRTDKLCLFIQNAIDGNHP